MMKNLENLKTLQPEVDYQALLAQMPKVTHPRRKLKELQVKGYLIRLKKGFYVFSKDFIGKDYSPQIVSNLLYGPSYLSLEYALAHYGLIPERVENFTCVTIGKNKIFHTAIGTFSYRHLSPRLYPMGVKLQEGVDGRSFLIATVEKALLDFFTLKFEKTTRPTSQDISLALEDDLRIDLSDLKKQLNLSALKSLRDTYKNRKWERALIQFLLEEL